MQKAHFKKNKRKVFLINPRFQLSFVGFILFGIMASLAVFYLADLFFFKQLVAQGKSLGLRADHVYFRLINDQKALKDKVFIGSGLFVFVSMFIFGIVLSHKIAGPLYRMKKYLIEQSLSNDAIPHLKFRDGDYFNEIPPEFNKFLATVERKRNLKIVPKAESDQEEAEIESVLPELPDLPEEEEKKVVGGN